MADRWVFQDLLSWRKNWACQQRCPKWAWWTVSSGRSGRCLSSLEKLTHLPLVSLTFHIDFSLPFFLLSDDLDMLAAEAMKQERLLPNNPVAVTVDDVRRLYSEALS